MLLVEMNTGPVYVDRIELEQALSGSVREFVVLFMAGQDRDAVGRELLASGADLVCESDRFTEAVKRVAETLVPVDRPGLGVPRLPLAARLSVLREALAGLEDDQISPAEAVARRGGSVLLLD